MARKNKTKKIKKKSPIFIFFSTVALIVGSFLALFCMAAFAYSKMNAPAPLPEPDFLVNNQVYADVDKTNPVQDFLLPPVKTNFLLAGSDANGALTDTIIVGCFDRETKEINLISIPRDTRIQMPEEELKALREAGRYPPSSGVMKINAVNSYAGKELGMPYLQRQVERLLGIKIHYHALVTLDAFRKIVEDVGGVTMEIPGNGLYYDDPEQNLYIRVPGGLQTLNGEMAEGVVRYRATYRRGDEERVEVQQKFMKEMFKQVLNKETIISSAPQLASTFISYVTTDFSIEDAPKYLRYLGELSGSDLITQTLPGAGQYVGDASYFICDQVETEKMVQKIFYSSQPTKREEITEKAALKIQILNGGYTAGMADLAARKLQKVGYKVDDIRDYTGTKKNTTRIYYRENAAIAENLALFFADPDLEMDDSGIDDAFDVVIIIGARESIEL